MNTQNFGNEKFSSAVETFRHNATDRIMVGNLALTLGEIALSAGIDAEDADLMPFVSHLAQEGIVRREALYSAPSGDIYVFDEVAYQNALNEDGFVDPETGHWVEGSVMLAPAWSICETAGAVMEMA